MRIFLIITLFVAQLCVTGCSRQDIQKAGNDLNQLGPQFLNFTDNILDSTVRAPGNAILSNLDIQNFRFCTAKLYDDRGCASFSRKDTGNYNIYYNTGCNFTWTTSQTYFLYAAAIKTVENGYDGFEIRSPIDFNKKGYVKNCGKHIDPVRTVSPPDVSSEIRPISGKVNTVPGKIFDARKLKAELDKIMNAPRCERNNICPHKRTYLK